MYELNKTGSCSYYINCPAKIGIYVKNDTDAYLIDSGNDKDAGKKVLKILNEQGWSLKGIINTHSHADHIGGNNYLQKQTGCKVFAGGIERAFTEHPVLEPSFLFGAYPNGDLRHKFLLAQESEAVDFSDTDFPKELEVVPLYGHSFDMVGIKTPDGTFFAADCVSSEMTLAKYKISFIYDVAKYLETLDMLEEMQACVFVPSHAEPCDSMKALCSINRNTVYEIADKIKELLKEEMCFELLLSKLFEAYGLTMTNEQYVLVGSTVRSYLSWLKDGGEVSTQIKDNMLLWHSN